MSRTHKNTKNKGFDFNSKRCFGNVCMGYGKVAKSITKNKERTLEKKIILKEINHI